MKRADIVNVRGLLGGRARYRCGPARPGFHWEPQQVAQLVVDLENAAHDSHEEEDVAANQLYLGVITISPSKSGHSILLDGQQRLAVLVMFLAFARDRMPSDRDRNMIDRLLVRRAFGRLPEARLRLSPEDHAWFSHFILPPGATCRLPETSPLGSPRELLLCARFMEHTFAQYKAAQLSSIVDFLLHHTAVCRSLGEVRQTAATSMSVSTSLPALPAPDVPTAPMPPPAHPVWANHSAVPAARYRVAAE